MNIQPLADRVLIKPAAAEEKIGSIIVPDTAKEKPLKGEVVAAGKCCTVSMQAQNWNSKARNISSCVSLTYWL